MSQTGLQGSFKPSSAKDIIADGQYLERILMRIDHEKTKKNRRTLLSNSYKSVSSINQNFILQPQTTKTGRSTVLLPNEHKISSGS